MTTSVSKSSKDPTARSQLRILADSLGLNLVDTNSVMEILTDDILLSLYGRTESLDAKIKRAFSNRHPHGKFLDDGYPLAATMLLGPPGHGKTSVMRAASKKVAALLGLNFLDNPPIEQAITKDDFIFVSMEFAGTNSSLQIRGLPFKMTDATTGEEFLSFLQDRNIAMIQQAGGGTLLLDDLLNASAAIINVALPLAEEKRFNNTHLKGFYVGATGNLGSVDGTKTSGMTSALRGRCRTIMVRDSAEDFVKRIRAKYQDELGDCYFANFVARTPTVIEEIPSSQQMGGYGSPRTMEKALVAFRHELAKVGGKERGIEVLQHFDNAIGPFLGPAIARELKSFIHSAFEQADPSARMLINDGETGAIVLARAEKAMSAEGALFFHQFGEALADYASMRIKEKGPASLEETMTRFGTGLFMMQGGAPITHTMELFIERLITRVPTLGVQATASGSDSIAKESRFLTTETMERIYDTLTAHPSFIEEVRHDLINISSGNSKFTTQAATKATRKRRGQ